MAHIGNLGGVVFSVRRGHVLTFDGLSTSSDARTATHAVMGQKNRVEFLGPGTVTASMTISLFKSLGVNPAKELERLNEMKDTGAVVPLIVGGKPIGGRQYIITKVDADYRTFDGFGRPTRIDVKVSIMEYERGRTHV